MAQVSTSHIRRRTSHPARNTAPRVHPVVTSAQSTPILEHAQPLQAACGVRALVPCPRHVHEHGTSMAPPNMEHGGPSLSMGPLNMVAPRRARLFERLVRGRARLFERLVRGRARSARDRRGIGAASYGWSCENPAIRPVIIQPSGMPSSTERGGSSTHRKRQLIREQLIREPNDITAHTRGSSYESLITSQR